jgi:hypothetical protein
MFGLAFAFFRGRLGAKSDWSRSLSLAAALFGGVALLPFLKYPSNPPGVGTPTTHRKPHHRLLRDGGPFLAGRVRGLARCQVP